jgi:hypothetical protein
MIMVVVIMGDKHKQGTGWWGEGRNQQERGKERKLRGAEDRSVLHICI